MPFPVLFVSDIADMSFLCSFSSINISCSFPFHVYVPTWASQVVFLPLLLPIRSGMVFFLALLARCPFSRWAHHLSIRPVPRCRVSSVSFFLFLPGKGAGLIQNPPPLPGLGTGNSASELLIFWCLKTKFLIRASTDTFL